jgi:hypothetical protein
LIDRIESRKRAYSYLLKKARELNLASKYRDKKIANDIGYISLNELTELKEGKSDPPLQVVASLKKLLRGTVNETEIDNYLVRPFVDQNLSPDRIKNT